MTIRPTTAPTSAEIIGRVDSATLFAETALTDGDTFELPDGRCFIVAVGYLVIEAM